MFFSYFLPFFLFYFILLPPPPLRGPPPHGGGTCDVPRPSWFSPAGECGAAGGGLCIVPVVLFMHVPDYPPHPAGPPLHGRGTFLFVVVPPSTGGEPAMFPDRLGSPPRGSAAQPEGGYVSCQSFFLCTYRITLPTLRVPPSTGGEPAMFPDRLGSPPWGSAAQPEGGYRASRSFYARTGLPSPPLRGPPLHGRGTFLFVVVPPSTGGEPFYLSWSPLPWGGNIIIVRQTRTSPNADRSGSGR